MIEIAMGLISGALQLYKTWAGASAEEKAAIEAEAIKQVGALSELADKYANDHDALTAQTVKAIEDAEAKAKAGFHDEESTKP